jgi:hypothetical protein
LDQSYFNYATGLKMIKVQKWEELFGFKNREADSDLEQFHCNMALAIQTVTEEIVIKMAKEAKRITGSDYLCMAGGVALNCVANGKLLKENIFKEIYIQPASGDAGGSLGAALAISTMYYNEPRIITNGEDQMSGTYLGPDFSEKEIVLMNKKTNAISKKYQNFATSSNTTNLEELIQFIGSADNIITDSYHTMYWAMLMKKKVIAIPNSSKFYDFKHQPIISNFDEALQYLNKGTTYDGLLQECRDLNHKFAEKAFNYLNV